MQNLTNFLSHKVDGPDSDTRGEEAAQAQVMELICLNNVIVCDNSSAMDICEEYFGLEPDYLTELIPC